MKRKMHAGFSIIDVHGHLGCGDSYYQLDNPLRNLIALMDKVHIEKACCSHIAGVVGHHFDYAHRQTLNAINEYPGRIFGYAIYDPNYLDESMESVKNFTEKDGFIGIKIHPAYHQYLINGENYDLLWKYAFDNGLPVLVHTWDAPLFVGRPLYSEPKLVAPVAEKYPGVKIIMAHAGGHRKGLWQSVQVVNRFENVLVDISGCIITFGLVEWLVGKIGAEKTVFGSDFNCNDPRANLGRILGARISDFAREQILRLNACRLFDFDSP